MWMNAARFTTLASAALLALTGCGSSGTTKLFDDEPDGASPGDAGPSPSATPTPTATGDAAPPPPRTDSGTPPPPPPSGCTSDGSCLADAPHCDTSTGVCLECLTDAHCASGEACVTGVCAQSVPITCADSRDCVGASNRETVCNAASAECVQCVRAADCNPTEDCIANGCEPFDGCRTSADCTRGVCNTTIGRCFECAGDVDCDAGDRCVAGTCEPGCDSDNDCTPLGRLCDITNGFCAECLDDSQCATGDTCVFGTCTSPCTPATCADLAAECGVVADGCGALLQCGQCSDPLSCQSYLCVCDATTCADANADCGTIPDGCGGSLDCGSCSAPDVCGGGGPNTCGQSPPTPVTCADAGRDCGPLADGVGGLLDCGTCTAPQACGGAGVAGVCGCASTSCAAASAECGIIDDGCGATLDCGVCGGNDTCGGCGNAGDPPNACACCPSECDARCGSVDDGCGGTQDCGACATCTDGLRNGSEVGVDCGGTCPACPVGCFDGVQNGNETGVDCGGSCGRCTGTTCTSGGQCASLSCPGTLCGFFTTCSCASVSCSDGIKNGNELGVDCAGSCGVPCQTGEPCTNNAGCLDGPCVSNVCTCTPLTTADCGTSACGSIPDGCGGTIDCGGCGSGETCYQNACCQPTTVADCIAGTSCGTTDNGCGGTFNCGGCGTGNTCVNGTCCALQFTAADCVPGTTCGAVPNGCGATVDCGGCDSGEGCGGGGRNTCGDPLYVTCTGNGDCGGNGLSCMTHSGTFGTSSIRRCTDSCDQADDCPSGPGNANPECNNNQCQLTCSSGSNCPSGMTCSGNIIGSGVCYWP